MCKHGVDLDTVAKEVSLATGLPLERVKRWFYRAISTRRRSGRNPRYGSRGRPQEQLASQDSLHASDRVAPPGPTNAACFTGCGFVLSSSSAYAELEISRGTSFNRDLGAAFVVCYHNGFRSRSFAALTWLRLGCALLARSFAAGSVVRARCWLRRVCALLGWSCVLAAGSGVRARCSSCGLVGPSHIFS